MTAEPLPPYSGQDWTCPKCGATRVELRRMFEGLPERYAFSTTYAPTAFETVSAEAVLGITQDTFEMKVGGEGMLRTCPNCGYEWREACLDACPAAAEGGAT